MTGSGARLWHGYARLYGPMAVAGWLILFLPLFEPVQVADDDGRVWYRAEYGTLWEIATYSGGSPAAVAIALAAAWIGGLVVATVRPTASPRPPIWIASLATMLAIMLATRPGFGDVRPDLSPAGSVGMALAVSAAGLAVAHAIHAGLVSRPRRGLSDSSRSSPGSE